MAAPVSDGDENYVVAEDRAHRLRARAREVKAILKPKAREVKEELATDATDTPLKRRHGWLERLITAVFKIREVRFAPLIREGGACRPSVLSVAKPLRFYGAQPSGAISKLENRKPGATVHPTRVQAPVDSADCHAPVGTIP